MQHHSTDTCATVTLFAIAAIEQHLSTVQAAGGAVDRTSLGKCLVGFKWLCGADSAAYKKWREVDWIGFALELYDDDKEQSRYALGSRIRRKSRGVTG